MHKVLGGLLGGGGVGGRVRVMGLAAYLSKNKIIKNEKKNSLNEGDGTII